MIFVLSFLLIQCAMGAFDSLWHHEITERLPYKRSARRELALHSAREFLYAIVFIGLAWREWRGLWAWVLAGILLVEIAITIADFLEEDRTRSLPALERIVHTVLAVNYGAWLAVFAPYLLNWSSQETALTPVEYEWLSPLLTLAGVGVFAWSLRNLYAVLCFSRPPEWVRHPLFVGRRVKPKIFLVTGATGFVGTALVKHLLQRGDHVIVLTRDADKALDRFGPHVRVVISLDQLDDSARIDGIVNLAGARIIAMPWSKARRRVLLDSRLKTTNDVLRLCARLQTTPRVLVSGSAIGYYGVRDDENCDESTSPRMQFQSELCQHWEAAALAAKELGVRVVLLRTGLVLGREGGALPMMSLPVRLFVGAALGSGRQWISWIHLDDMIRLIELSLDRPAISGPMNAVAPTPVRHLEFYRELATRLRRPLWMRIPELPIRALLGEMSQMLLDGQRVIPHKAGEHGFRFAHPTLRSAFRATFASPNHQRSVTEVYFNGDCPVCNAEMTHYRELGAAKALPLCFIDSIRQPNAFAGYGLRKEHLEERLYVRDDRGKVMSGLTAMLQLWTQLPGYRWLAKLLALPIIRPAATAAYDLIVAPLLVRWARQRRAVKPAL